MPTSTTRLKSFPSRPAVWNASTPKAEFFDSFADYLGIDESRWELFRTGYLVREDDQVRFSHENILYFLSTLTMRSARSTKD